MKKLNFYEKDLDDLNALYICAERYAIGRETYMPKLVMDAIMAHDDTLQLNTVYVMIQDIEQWEAEGKSFGMDFDKTQWMRFLAWLKQKRSKI